MRVILEFSEAFNRHDLPGMARLLSSECLLDSAAPAPGGTACTGKDAVMQFWQSFFEQHPEARLEIEGDLRLWRALRDALEAPAGGRGPGTSRGVDVFRVKDGLICEQHAYVKGLYG